MEFKDLDYNKDIPEVVDLIRKNLNPTYSKEILEWKHLKNPFGKSESIVAIENDKIVGVIFVIRYNYKNNKGEILKAIRPVDACTHISQRGRGIFKKIMKICIGRYEGDYDFIMSNPNRASYPGHIKSGFVESPRIHYYKVGILLFLGRLKGELTDFNKNEIFSGGTTKNNKEIIGDQTLLLAGNTLEFLCWRYRQEKYIIKRYFINASVNYIVYRKETIKKLQCIVLCDFYGDISVIDAALRIVCQTEGRYFVYFLDNKITSKIKFLWTKKVKRAYIVFKPDNFELPENLIITLGDIEARL